MMLMRTGTSGWVLRAGLVALLAQAMSVYAGDPPPPSENPEARTEPAVFDPRFQIELYASLPVPISGIVYSSGDTFPAGVYAVGVHDNGIYRVTAPQTYSVFAADLPRNKYEPVLDTQGYFGYDMYVAAIDNYSGPTDMVLRVDPSGNVTTFKESGYNGLDGLAPGIALGPEGTSFEGYLYVPDVEHQTLLQLDPEANHTQVPFPMSRHEAKDLEFGPGGDWGAYAYLVDAEAHKIRRLAEDGSSEVFFEWDVAEIANIRSFAFGNGGLFGTDLYGGTNASTVWRIQPDGSYALFADLGVQKIAGTEFGNRELFVSSLGELFRITSRVGDMNCDGAIDFDDIHPFVLAISTPNQYVQQYPDCDLILADCNGDGFADFDDITAFVSLL